MEQFERGPKIHVRSGERSQVLWYPKMAPLCESHPVHVCRVITATHSKNMRAIASYLGNISVLQSKNIKDHRMMRLKSTTIIANFWTNREPWNDANTKKCILSIISHFHVWFFLPLSQISTHLETGHFGSSPSARFFASYFGMNLQQG